MKLALAAALLVSACGQPSAYPDAYGQNFVANCVRTGGNRAMCECTWARIETEVPRAEYDEFERELRAGRTHPFTDRLLDYGFACQAQVDQQRMQ